MNIKFKKLKMLEKL